MRGRFGNVDGLTGEVRGSGVASDGRGVAVGADQALLDGDGADGGIDLEGRVEGGVEVAAEDREKGGGPGAGVAAVFRQAIVDGEGLGFREGYELLFAAEVEQVGVIADTVKAITVGHFVLVEQDFAGAAQRCRHDQATAAVIQRGDTERRQDDGRGGFFFDTFERQSSGQRGSEDAASVDERGGFPGIRLQGRCFVQLGARYGTRSVMVRGEDGGVGGEDGLGLDGAVAAGSRCARSGCAYRGGGVARGGRCCGVGTSMKGRASVAVAVAGPGFSPGFGVFAGGTQAERRGIPTARAGEGPRGLGQQGSGAEQQTGQRA